jgi:PLP dependent protein
MDHIKKNLECVIRNIESSCLKSNRDISDITLVAVSKTFPADYIEKAYEFGQFHFGENKLQEAESKIISIQKNVTWHYIGRIQRNKVIKILKLFSVIESVDSLDLAVYINTVSAKNNLKPNIFLQVNLSGETSKGGFNKYDLIMKMPDLLNLANLTITGLMCIPPNCQINELSRTWFEQLRMLRDELERNYDCKLPSLSMGMSNDYNIAIEEGSTNVRIGSALFGNRIKNINC